MILKMIHNDISDIVDISDISDISDTEDYTRAALGMAKGSAAARWRRRGRFRKASSLGNVKASETERANEELAL